MAALALPVHVICLPVICQFIAHLKKSLLSRMIDKHTEATWQLVVCSAVTARHDSFCIPYMRFACSWTKLAADLIFASLPNHIACNIQQL